MTGFCGSEPARSHAGVILNRRQHKGEPRLPFNVSLRALFIIEGWSIVVFGTHPLLRFFAIPMRDQEQTYFFER